MTNSTNSNVLDSLNKQIEAIDALKDCTCAINQTLQNLDFYTGPPVLGPAQPSPPAGTTLSEYNAYRCKAANFIYTWLYSVASNMDIKGVTVGMSIIAAILTLTAIGASLATGAGEVALIVGALESAATAGAVWTGIASAISGAVNFSMSNIVTKLEDNKTAIIQALYNSTPNTAKDDLLTATGLTNPDERAIVSALLFTGLLDNLWEDRNHWGQLDAYDSVLVPCTGQPPTDGNSCGYTSIWEAGTPALLSGDTLSGGTVSPGLSSVYGYYVKFSTLNRYAVTITSTTSSEGWFGTFGAGDCVNGEIVNQSVSLYTSTLPITLYGHSFLIEQLPANSTITISVQRA